MDHQAQTQPKKLQKFNLNISDEQLRLHIINNLPREYDVMQEALEILIDDDTDLDIEKV